MTRKSTVLLSLLLFFFDVLEVSSVGQSNPWSLVGDIFSTGPRISTTTPKTGQLVEKLECTTPPYPQNGKWKLAEGNAKPGNKILESSIIIFECDIGYKLSTKTKYLLCDDEWERAEIPECEELCPPLYSSTIYELNCIDKMGKEIKCHEATNGTLLEYNCAPFYETPLGNKKAFLCRNKEWDEKPVCVPVCGKKITDDTKTLIYGSKPNENLEYPWVAALYLKMKNSFENICGASILSETVVLTAAHCVTNDYGDVLWAKNYAVGAGKLFNKYKAQEDTHAQYLKISKIIVPEDYRADRKRFLGDIAVLVTDGEFVFNKVIQPVCFNNMKDIHLHTGSIGEISGWGLVEGEVASDILRTLKIPYKYETTCVAEFPKDWADKYNMEDKICTGFVNQSTSVCDGDSGSGLAFINSDDNRYYIHGLVSLGPKADIHCDIQQNTLYTKVAHYYYFVQNLLTLYNPKIKDCKLPANPKNGKFSFKDRKFKPGDIVPSSTIITITCNKGYKPSTSLTSVECGSSNVLPRCEKLCPKTRFPKGTYVQCTSKEGQSINCIDAIDGTKIFYICPPLYQSPNGTNNDRTCVKGNWDPSEPKCVRISKECGKLISSGSNSQKAFEHPWTAGIYKLDNGTEGGYKYICGASIISKVAVLTAAQCVTDESGLAVSKEKYFIGVGKIYAKYNHSRDTQAQYTQVAYITVHPFYKPQLFNPGDIAIVFVQDKFNFDTFIQPVCLPEPIDEKLRAGDGGVISGWRLETNDTFNEPEALDVAFTDYNVCDAKSSKILIEKREKLCVRFRNGTVCMRPSDVGKGFYRKNREDGRYYIHGIVSTVADGVQRECTKKLSLTDTLFYYDFFNCALVISKFYFRTTN